MANARASFKLSLFFSNGAEPVLGKVVFGRLGSDTSGWKEITRTLKTEKADDRTLHFLWKQGTQGWALALLDYRLNGEASRGLWLYNGLGSSSACNLIEKQEWLKSGFDSDALSDRQFAQQIFKVRKGDNPKTTRFQINSNLLAPASVRIFVDSSRKQLPASKIRALAEKIRQIHKPHRTQKSHACASAEKQALQLSESGSVRHSNTESEHPIIGCTAPSKVANIRAALNELLDQAAAVEDSAAPPRFVLKAEFPIFHKNEFPAFGESQNPDEFLIFLSNDHANLPERPILRISRSAESIWKSDLLPASQTRGTKLFGLGDQLLSVSEHGQGNELVKIRPMIGGPVIEMRPPRNYKWTSVTDVKLSGAFLLVSFCGGDVWRLDITSRQFSCVRPGSDEVKYCYADFLSPDLIIFGSDDSEQLEIISIAAKKIVKTISMSEPTNFICCFPEHEMIAVGGMSGTSILSSNDWRVIRTDNAISLGL